MNLFYLSFFRKTKMSMRKGKHSVSAGRLFVGEKGSRNKRLYLWTGEYVTPIYFQRREDKTQISLLVLYVRARLDDFLTL